MASSDNEDVCIPGSSTEGELEVKLVAKHLSLVIRNVSVATNIRTFIFPVCDSPSLCPADSRNGGAIKFISPCHAPLLPPFNNV